MKINNFLLINIMNTLNNYSESKLPQKITYAITRNLVNVQKEYEIYEKQLKKIFEEYNEHFVKDEDGNTQYSPSGLPMVADEVREEFAEQVNELLSIEVEFDSYYVDESVFDYEEKEYHTPLSARDIITLQGIICKKEEEKKDEE